jgi:hypothetical protein
MLQGEIWFNAYIYDGPLHLCNCSTLFAIP